MADADGEARLKLPADWSVAPLGEVFEILDSKRKPLNREERSRIPGSYPYYGANGMVDRVGEWIFDEPLVLMAEDGGYFDEFATRPIAYLIDGPSWVNNHAHVLRAKPGHCREWLFHSLVHRDIRPYINSGTRSKLNQADMRRIPMPLPPLPEQRKIAAILSSVDETIEKTEAVIDQLQVAKKAMMEELLTRGMPGRHTRFKQTEIGEIPEGWEVRPLGDLCSKIVDGVHQKPDYVTSGVPFVTVKNLTAGPGISFESLNYITAADHALFCRRARPERGDVLLSKDGTLGVPRVIETDTEFSIFVSVALLKPHRERLDAHFLRYALECEAITKQFGLTNAGSALKHIHLVDLRRTRCPVPSISEQKELASRFLALDELDSAERQASSSLRELKRALAAVLLSGDLRVTPDEAPP